MPMLRDNAEFMDVTVAIGARVIECTYRKRSWWFRLPDCEWQTVASLGEDRTLFDALMLGPMPARESRLTIGPPPLSGSLSNNTYPPEAWFWTVESPRIGSAS